MIKKFCIISLIFYPVVSWAQPLIPDDMTPRWSEFCPGKYQYAFYMNVPQVSNYHRSRSNAAGLIWKATSRRYVEEEQQAIENNYWVSRRDVFNRVIRNCQNYQGDKLNCFMQIRSIESQKTASHNQQLQSDTMITQSARGSSEMHLQNSINQIMRPVTRPVMTNCNGNTLGGMNCTSW